MANNLTPEVSVKDTHIKYGGSGSFADRAKTFEALGLGSAASYIGSGAQNKALRLKIEEVGGLTLPAPVSAPVPTPAPTPAPAPAPTAAPAATPAPEAVETFDVELPRISGQPAVAQTVYPTFEAPQRDPRLDEAIDRLIGTTHQRSDRVTELEQRMNDKLAALDNQNAVIAQQLESALQRILNPEKFEYDFATDPRYIAMKDEYIRNGRLAMLDTGAAAAAANGGRETSYGRAAAQQAYQNYVAGLNDIIPELEERAYSRYRDSLQDEKDKYTILAGERDRERENAVEDLRLAMELYQNASDEELKMYDLTRSELKDAINLLSERENTDYEHARDVYTDELGKLDYETGRSDTAYERERYEKEYADERKDKEYNKLAALISNGYTGYTDAELAAAGMTPAQADSLKAAYQLELASAKSSGGSGGGGSRSSGGSGFKAATADAKLLSLTNKYGSDSLAIAKDMHTLYRSYGSDWANYAENTYIGDKTIKEILEDSEKDESSSSDTSGSGNTSGGSRSVVKPKTGTASTTSNGGTKARINPVRGTK